MRTRFLVPALVATLVGCSQEPTAPTEPAAPASPAVAAEATPAVPAAQAPAPVLDPVAAAEEACGQILVVSYAGAAHAKPEIKRDKETARARASELLAKVTAGEAFAAVAKANSDAPSSAASGGFMGTFTRAEWPEIHRPLEATVYGLAVDAVAADPVEAPYGFVLVRRCKVEKAHSRHILVRYAGADRAGPEITRSKSEAFQLAVDLQRKLTNGADFAEVAQGNSDDASKERGGDVGTWGRGRMSAAYEEALFALKPGGISVTVESEHGYHIIQRLAIEEEPIVLDEPTQAPAPTKAAPTNATPVKKAKVAK